MEDQLHHEDNMESMYHTATSMKKVVDPPVHGPDVGRDPAFQLFNDSQLMPNL